LQSTPSTAQPDVPAASLHSVLRIPTESTQTSATEPMLAALRNIERPLYAVTEGRSTILTDRAPHTLEGLAGVIPAVRIESFGSASFRKAHNLRCAYVAGAMAGGIASVDLVVDMAQAGFLAFFGAGALPLPAIEQAIRQIEARLPGGESYGVNLLHNYYDEKLEWATVELYLSLGVTRVEAAAFVSISAPLVYYRVKGIHRTADGCIVVPNHVFAKVSRPEVATQFLAPPPQQLLAELVAAGKISADEAALAALVPMANELTCEADSGGHTDRRPLSVLLPMMLHEREQAMERHSYEERGIEIRLGAAGGIGEPLSVHAAFAEDGEPTQAAFGFARAQGIPTSVDPKESHIDAYRGVNILTPNQTEASIWVTDLSRMNPIVSLATAGATGLDIPLWLTAPFALLLLLIAVMPLTPPRVKHLWDRYYMHTALGLGLAVVAYYLWHAGEETVLDTSKEYFSFISLIGSLFVVAGGIHLKVKGEATPLGNVVFLAIGAVVANLIGTTGASMVLIRPFIRMNHGRISAYHVVFFIFIVANCGGALTPIGDPPLFIGYLRGVPFFWLMGHVMPQWLFTIAAILAVFYACDCRSHRRVPGGRTKIGEHDTWRFEGGRNVAWLLVIIGAVFLPDKFLLRELVMLGAAAASYRLTPQVVHDENHFGFGPIKEVAFLFIGIFATMMPALDYLRMHGQEFGVVHPLQYYFACGALSSVLDNAPTYVNFLQLAQATSGTANPVHLLGAQPLLVIGVSLGAVFFGAMTYIGNGPNLMVKSIAHDAGVRCPTFFGYILKYSLPILLPILALAGWLFL